MGRRAKSSRRRYRPQLGQIRTQELSAARNIDGGKQFFTRANDFGYSKSPFEAIDILGKETVLGDVVWAIRKLQPDVIINRFSLEAGYTHGHNTASAQLALEAFEAVADPSTFPEQLKWVDTWPFKCLVWSTSS